MEELLDDGRLKVSFDNIHPIEKSTAETPKNGSTIVVMTELNLNQCHCSVLFVSSF